MGCDALASLQSSVIVKLFDIAFCVGILSAVEWLFSQD